VTNAKEYAYDQSNPKLFFSQTPQGRQPSASAGSGAVSAVRATQAQSYTILRNFGLRQGDPLAPTSLILDKSGKLYGTTGADGNRGDGEGTVVQNEPHHRQANRSV
jgi:hypothetical protein